MNQAAVKDRDVRPKAAPADDVAAATRAPAMLEDLQGFWRRNLAAGTETARAFQTENMDFAKRLMALNREAASAFDPAAPAQTRIARSFEVGASAFELYMAYLARSAGLAQRAVVLPWVKEPPRA
jgi:hypothetical protein